MVKVVMFTAPLGVKLNYIGVMRVLGIYDIFDTYLKIFYPQIEIEKYVIFIHHSLKGLKESQQLQLSYEEYIKTKLEESLEEIKKWGISIETYKIYDENISSFRSFLKKFVEELYESNRIFFVKEKEEYHLKILPSDKEKIENLIENSNIFILPSDKKRRIIQKIRRLPNKLLFADRKEIGIPLDIDENYKLNQKIVYSLWPSYFYENFHNKPALIYHIIGYDLDHKYLLPFLTLEAIKKDISDEFNKDSMIIYLSSLILNPKNKKFTKYSKEDLEYIKSLNQTYGSDVVRFSLSLCSWDKDEKLGEKHLRQAYKIKQKVKNILNFFIMNNIASEDYEWYNLTTSECLTQIFFESPENLVKKIVDTVYQTSHVAIPQYKITRNKDIIKLYPFFKKIYNLFDYTNYTTNEQHIGSSKTK